MAEQHKGTCKAKVEFEFVIPESWYFQFIDDVVELLERSHAIFSGGKMNSIILREIFENTQMDCETLNNRNYIKDLCFNDIKDMDAKILASSWKIFLEYKIRDYIKKINKT